MVVVVADAGCAGPGNEIVVDNIMAKHTSSIGNSIGGLVVVHYIVDVLRVGLGERLAVVPAHPEIAVVGSLIAFNMCTELLANWEGNNGVGNRDVGNTDAIDGIPLPICDRAMVQNNTDQQSVSTSLAATYHLLLGTAHVESAFSSVRI